VSNLTDDLKNSIFLKPRPNGSTLITNAPRFAAERIDQLEANQVKAEALIAALHEQVYDNSHLDKQVELYFALKDKG
jgi:hypothetical protein